MGDPLASSDVTSLLDDICAAGYNVVNVDYGLVPDCRFPVPVIQANQALAWCEAHAGEYGIDMDDAIVMGSSAGAIITSQMGAVISNPEYAAELGIQPALRASQVRAVVIDDAPLVYDEFSLGTKILIGNYVRGTIFLTTGPLGIPAGGAARQRVPQRHAAHGCGAFGGRCRARAHRPASRARSGDSSLLRG